MPDLLITHTHNRTTGAPADAVQNTFAVSAPGAFVASVHGPLLADAVANFYRGPAPGASLALGNYMNRSLSPAANDEAVRIYDISGHLDGSPHGSPIYTELYTWPYTPADPSLPSEVAAAVTLRGVSWASQPVETPDGPDAGSALDRPRQRHTGKLYLGPLTTIAILSSSSPYVARLHPSFIDDIGFAAQRLADDIRAVLAGTVWCVWSRADTFLYTLTDIQVDNAPDTQRRRGERSSTRTTVDIST